MAKYLRLIKFLKNFKKDVAGKIAIGLFSSAFGFFQAFMIASAIDSVFKNNTFDSILPYLVGALTAILMRSLISRYHEGYTKKMAAKVKGHIRAKLLDKIMQMGPAYQNNKRSGNVQSLITDGVESFEAFLINYVPQTAIVFISVTAVITIISFMDLSVGLLIFASAVLSIIIPHFFMKAVSRVMIKYWKSYAHLNAQYIETMQGMNTLKAFHASKKKMHQLESDANDFADESVHNTGISLADSALIILLTAVGTSISVALAAWHTANGTLPLQYLLIILFLAGECMRPLSDLNTYWHSSYLGFSVADQLYAVLDAPITIKESEGNIDQSKSNKLPKMEFKNVSFSYSEDAELALSNVNMGIKAGKTVAIVGRSGSGKSTMVNLLLRFFDVNSGEIYIDDIDIRDYNLSYLRDQIAVVFQDTYLFYGTVEKNLLMAKPDATKEEIVAATKAANAHSFIEKLPNGYNTVVGERGATLSGGEKQRIAIARAILKDAPVLVLDEATSNVDVESERLIQKAMTNLTRNRTTVIIAHRLSTIENADKIYVLNKGNVTERGTHSVLINNDGEYANLVRTQQNAGGII
jgi:ABC-type multidrug transport system fused ATPase/permease subunit